MTQTERTKTRTQEGHEMNEQPRIDDQTAAEIERTAEDLAFEADTLDNLERIVGEPELGEVARVARELAERVLQIRDQVNDRWYELRIVDPASPIGLVREKHACTSPEQLGAVHAAITGRSRVHELDIEHSRIELKDGAYIDPPLTAAEEERMAQVVRQIERAPSRGDKEAA